MNSKLIENLEEKINLISHELITSLDQEYEMLLRRSSVKGTLRSGNTIRDSMGLTINFSRELYSKILSHIDALPFDYYFEIEKDITNLAHTAHDKLKSKTIIKFKQCTVAAGRPNLFETILPEVEFGIEKCFSIFKNDLDTKIIIIRKESKKPGLLSKLLEVLSKKWWAGLGVIVAVILTLTSMIYSNSDLNSEPDITNSKQMSETVGPNEKVIGQEEKNGLNLSSLINSINSSNNDNLGDIYKGLKLIVNKSNPSERLRNIIDRWKEPLVAKIVGDKVLISTIKQYKVDGFILFFELETESLLSASYDFGLGVQAVKVFDTKGISPEYLISVKYMTRSGTGIYGESVRVYALEKNMVSIALDKPYTEYIDGSWGAYKSNVRFEQNNKLIMSSSSPKIITAGQVTYTNLKGKEVQVTLPNEEYIWDKHHSIFEQINGRETKGIKTMSALYADYAEPNGDWFESPRDSSDTAFKTERW